ncbi:MAG: C40 family peptidase [Bacteroidaceae bacterium]|nr:C40 family peptidase [Bacteroidaceae bacterium]
MYGTQPDGPQREASCDQAASAVDALPLQREAPTTTAVPMADTESVRQQLYNVAMQYLGRPYRSGASGPQSFDCSGFTSYVYKSLNILLSRSSRDQYLEGVPVNRTELQVGDLVFFARGGKRGRISHVGMVCEVQSNGNFKFVHACSRGVSIDDFGTAAYYQARYVGARRIIQNYGM